MRGALALAGLIVAASAAHAQTLVAIAGHPVRFYQAYSTNPDCTSSGQVVVRITQAPEHGRVTVKNANVFPNFPASNIRSVCNRRRVAGVVVQYVSERGYTGVDQAAIQVVYLTGTSRTFSASLTVQP